MNVDEIRKVINANFDDKNTERLIISILAKDENVTNDIIQILAEERRTKKELIMDMNLELSRAHIYIDEYSESVTQSNKSFNKSFVVDEIAKFYNKYRPQITHCFNRFK